MKLIDKSKLPRAERQGKGAPTRKLTGSAAERRLLTTTFDLRRQGRFLGCALLLGLAWLYFNQKRVGSFQAISVSSTTFFFQTESTIAPSPVESYNAVSECPLEPCNLSIVFLGDSVTRFMYVSLAYFLRHNNTWIDPDSFPNLVSAGDFLEGVSPLRTAWTPFFRASTLALAPYEVCDCFREAWGGGKSRTTICENRYFWDPTRNNSIVYFHAFGSTVPSRGHFSDPVATLRRHPSTMLLRNEIPWERHHPFNWTYFWSDMIRFQVAPLRPSVFIFNAGLWEHDFQEGNPGFVQEVLSAINETLLNNNHSTEDHQQPPPPYKPTQVIWKTTTPANGCIYPHGAVDRMMCSKLAALQNDPQMTMCCLNLTDALLGTPSNYYLDHYHFREPAYRLMNEQLLLDTLNLRIQLPVASGNDVGENTTGYYYQRLDAAVHWPPESFRR